MKLKTVDAVSRWHMAKLGRIVLCSKMASTAAPLN